MKKLLIFIPCFNEEKNLRETFQSIPKKIKSVSNYEVIVVDDGSTDRTIQEAANLNLKVIKHKEHIGLAKIFNSIVDYFMKTEFDCMCILDADNQYSSGDIEKLISEMIEKNLDMVVGSRNIIKEENMSLLKKFFQLLGSWIVSLIIGCKIHDVTSGFRLYNKNCFKEYFQIENNFSYTIESLIIFSWRKLNIGSIYIKTNRQKLRPSRLFKSNSEYIKKQTIIILKNFNKYFPFKFFSIISFFFLFPGILISIRFLFIHLSGGDGHIQSLILASILIISSMLIFVMGILSYSISDIKFQLEKLKYKTNNRSSYEIID